MLKEPAIATRSPSDKSFKGLEYLSAFTARAVILVLNHSVQVIRPNKSIVKRWGIMLLAVSTEGFPRVPVSSREFPKNLLNCYKVKAGF